MHLKVTNHYINGVGNQVATVHSLTPPAIDPALAEILAEARVVAIKLAQYSERQLDVHPDQKLYGTEILLQGIKVKGTPNG